MRYFLITLFFLSSYAFTDRPENWPENIEVPGWWPVQVALYPGSMVADIDHAESKGLPDIETYIHAEGNDLDKIVQWYKASLEKAGWEVWKIVNKGHSKRITSQNVSLDKRVIIQVIKPKQSIFNKSEDYRVNIIVYRSIP